MILAIEVIGAIWVYVMGVVATVAGMDRFVDDNKDKHLAYGVAWPLAVFLALPVLAGHALGQRGPRSAQLKERRIAELEKELEIK